MPAQPHAPITIGPITVTFTVDAEQSNGSVTVSRCDVAAGAGMPVAHSHDLFEETLYGVEGVTTLVVEGERVELGPGDTFCIERGAVHTFSADAGDAAFLAIATPGLFGPAYFHELKAVVDAAQGGPPDPQAVMAVMRAHGLTPAPARGVMDPELTPRQREILRLMAEGLSNAAIARRLGVREKSVVRHCSNIYDALGLRPSPEEHRRVLAVVRHLQVTHAEVQAA